MRIIFRAIAVNEFGQTYDASFSITQVQPGATQQDLDNVVQSAIQMFREYHPNGQIIGRQIIQ